MQNSAKAVDTRQELAKVAGVSHDTIAKVETIEEKAPEPVVQASRSGAISVSQLIIFANSSWHFGKSTSHFRNSGSGFPFGLLPFSSSTASRPLHGFGLLSLHVLCSLVASFKNPASNSFFTSFYEFAHGSR